MDEKSITISVTKPIAIVENKYNQYSLTNVKFDPAQNSPPSLWKMRLHSRVGENPLKKSSINRF